MKVRITRFDLLRLLAMFLICMTHCFQRFYSQYSFLNTIFFALPYSFSLGLFFFTGGFFIKKTNSLKELGLYILKTLVTYLLPAYLFTCLSIWTLEQFKDHNFGYWMMILYKYTDTFYWYFLTACLINIPIAIFHYISHLIVKRDGPRFDVARLLFVIVGLAAYMLIFIKIYNRDYEEIGPKCLSSDMFLYYVPVVLIGFTTSIFSNYIKLNKTTSLMSLFTTIFSFVVWISIVIVYQNKWYQGLSGSFFDIFWRCISTIMGVLFFYQLAAYISRFSFIKRISSFGKYSGPFYLVHVYFIRLIYSYFTLPPSYQWYEHVFVLGGSLLFFFLSLLVTYCLVKFPYTDILMFANYKRISDLPFIKRENVF